MTRKLIVALSVAALLVFTLSAAAMAAGPGPNMDTPAGTPGMGLNANGVCDDFVDADGDGVCDSFLDEDGDGINDLAPQARLNRQAGGMRGRMAQAQSNARGFRFDDAAPRGRGFSNQWAPRNGSGLQDAPRGGWRWQ